MLVPPLPSCHILSLLPPSPPFLSPPLMSLPPPFALPSPSPSCPLSPLFLPSCPLSPFTLLSPLPHYPILPPAPHPHPSPPVPSPPLPFPFTLPYPSAPSPILPSRPLSPFILLSCRPPFSSPTFISLAMWLLPAPGNPRRIITIWEEE